MRARIESEVSKELSLLAKVHDKRSALDAPDTDDDDGCTEQGEGAGVEGPKPEQAGTRSKKLRWDGEARNFRNINEWIVRQ